MAMRVAGNTDGNGEGGKGNGNSNKGVRQGTAAATKMAMEGWRVRKRARVAMVMVTTMRWHEAKRAIARAARAMAITMRMVGK